MTTSAIRVGVHEAKTTLSELLRAVDSGQEVDILRGGVPVAELVAYAQPRPRTFGGDRGKFRRSGRLRRGVASRDRVGLLPLSAFLVDTHIWLWLQAAPERVPSDVRAALSEAATVFLSAASAWEIAIKYGLGRLPLPATSS